MIAMLLLIAVSGLGSQMSATQQAADSAARERARQAAREQFTEHFRSIQLLGIELLKAHEDGTLMPRQLEKNAKAIQKHARALRTLLALGPPAKQPRIDPRIHSRDQFDQAIRLLSKHVADFAHNPILKNPKVFDTDLAADAAAKLVAILDLAKVIERKASSYTGP